MTSLNEHEKQLFETLMNQADAVAPATDKAHSGHENVFSSEFEKDFHHNEHEVPDFQFLEHYINSEIGETEAMQFEQPASGTRFVSQQPAPQYQQAQESHQPAAGASSFQGQGASGFAGQQTEFSGVTGVKMEQSSAASFQDQGRGFQQVQSSQEQPSQMNITNPDNFQSQSTGFQQQYSPSGVSAKSGHVDAVGSVPSGFPAQPQAFSQQYSMETLSATQDDVAGRAGTSFQSPAASFHSQTQQTCSDSQAQTQPLSQHSSGFSSSGGKDQVSISPAVFHNPSTDYQHQSDYVTNSSANSQTIGQAAGFQQQYSSNFASKPSSEQKDFSEQQDFTNQVTCYQQQQTQSTHFHQSSQSAGNNNADQNYQAASTEGTGLCYSSDMSSFTHQKGQTQHQGTTPADGTAASPAGPQTGSIIHQQHAQFQNSPSSNTQAEQSSAGTFQGQVNRYQKQQSFSSPVASPPGQQAQSVPNSPAGYPQASPQATYSPSDQPTVLGDEGGGANFSGEVTGFSPAQVSGFPQELSFSSALPSTGQTHLDKSFPSSSSTYPQPSSGFNVQNAFSTHVPPPGQGDQNAGNSFPAQAPEFSPQSSVPTLGDSTGTTNFQGVFSTKSTIPEDPAGYQGKGSSYSQSTSVHNDSNKTQDHRTMAAEAAAAFLHSLQTANQQESQAMESGTAVSVQQNPAPPTSSQRDQPMETQQSPFATSFQNQAPAQTQQGLFESSAQPAQSGGPGNTYLNQTLPFHGQPNSFQTAAAVGGPTQGQNASFAQTSAVFGTQAVYSSGQSSNTSLTVSTPSVLDVQPAVSSLATNQYNPSVGNVSSFNQFPCVASSSFGHSTGQQQTQPQFQQAVQQTVYDAGQPQGGSLLQQNSPSLLSGAAQTLQFQSLSSAAQPAGDSQSASLLNSQQYGAGHFQAQQTVSNTGQQQQGMPISSGVAAPPSVASQMQFDQPAVNTAQVASMPGSTPVPSSTSVGKSPVASLQDSNQTNTALTLLSSVLQQIQAILPVAASQPTQNAASVTQPSPEVPTPLAGSNQALEKLLQSQHSAQEVLRLLQQQPGIAQKLGENTQKDLGQGVSRALQPPPANLSTAQHPNFLVQQGNSPNLIITQQQQGQQTQQQPLDQQMATQIPASTVTSNDTIDRQFVVGQQPVGVVLDANWTPMSGSVVFSVPSSLVLQSTAGVASLTSTTTVSFSGQSSLSQPGTQSPLVGRLPFDLQNVNLHQFSSASSSMTSSTHAINTTPTSAPNLGSNFSKDTFVTPTASFTQPLQVAGVGLGVGTLTSTGPVVTCVPTSSSDLGTSLAQNATISRVGSSPAIANIFFPVCSESGLEKHLVTSSGSNLPESDQVGNFLNVTTGSASMLLNAFSVAVADGKRDSSGLKIGGFSRPQGSAECTFSDLHSESPNAAETASEMDVSEPAAGAARSIKPMDTDKPVENVTPRHSFRKASVEEDLDQKGDAMTNSMLRKILTMKDEDDNGRQSKAGSPTSGTSPVPIELCGDGNTETTLIERSEKLRLGSDAPADEDVQPSFWTSIPSFANDSPEEVVPSKVHRGVSDMDTSSKQVSIPSVEKLFDAGGAVSSSSFVFTKFGTEVPGLITFGNSSSDATVTNVSTSDTKVCSSIVSSVKPVEAIKLGPLPTASIRPSARKQKDPNLTFQFPSKVGNCELRILAQPEEQHRARYLTEGSRGAVKDRSQQGYPVIKLLGYNEPAILQVFIGSETGRVKPHGFYQACKVCGKNSTQCSEREVDGTSVIEIEVSPNNDMQVVMDCVGILKLRNADVEKRIGPTKAKAKKKNSTKARFVFRTNLRKPDGSHFTLQVASTPILCTQPIGQPEISRMSLSELCVNQTSDLFIIGKNFMKGSQIMFQECGVDENDIKWKQEAEIEVEYFQQTHLICRIPEYPNKDVDHPVRCQIVAVSGGKVSDPQEFIYKPAMVMIKEENAMETEPSGTGKALPFGVSPVALQLNRLVERTQQYTSTSSAMFQLPPGTVPSVSNSLVVSAPPEVVSGASTRPLSSVVKPATLSLPTAGHALNLGSAGPGGGAGEGSKGGTVPVQFVLPPQALGSAIAVESRKLGVQQPQFVLMPNSAVAPPGGSTTANNKAQPSVLTLSSMPSSTNSPALLTAAGGGASQGPASTSSPMIVILTGPPTMTSPATNTVNNNSTAVPLSVQQSVNSGQVESLLKQILESSRPSSS